MNIFPCNTFFLLPPQGALRGDMAGPHRRGGLHAPAGRFLAQPGQRWPPSGTIWPPIGCNAPEILHAVPHPNALLSQVWSISELEEEPVEIHLGSGFRATCMVHPATYLNKVLVCSDAGEAQLWNFRSRKLARPPPPPARLTQRGIRMGSSPGCRMLLAGFLLDSHLPAPCPGAHLHRAGRRCPLLRGQPSTRRGCPWPGGRPGDAAEPQVRSPARHVRPRPVGRRRHGGGV